MPSETFFVYAIRSLKDGRIYVGISADPSSRLKQHNSGKTRSTKPIYLSSLLDILPVL
jgi:putative endonuclease